MVKSSFRKLIGSLEGTAWKRITTKTCTTFFGHDAPTPVHIAAKYGYVNAIRVLSALGADVCAAANTVGLTPLHIAAKGNHVDAIKELAAHLERTCTLRGTVEWGPWNMESRLCTSPPRMVM
jgi:hypothetical protein